MPNSRYRLPAGILCGLGRTRRKWATLAVVGLAALPGCAEVRTTDVMSIPVSRPAHRITNLVVLVRDETAYPPDPQERADQEVVRRQVAERLRFEINRRFESYGVGAAAGETVIPGTMVVECSLREVTEGNRFLRTAVGFGAGQAEMQIHTRVSVVTEQAPDLAGQFTTRSTTGYLPGVGLGLAGGLAGGSAVGIAGAGVKGAFDLRKTIDREVDELAEKIVDQSRTMLLARGHLVGSPAIMPRIVPAPIPPPVPFANPAASHRAGGLDRAAPGGSQPMR